MHRGRRLFFFTQVLNKKFPGQAGEFCLRGAACRGVLFRQERLTA
mgnify:FL=1